MEISSPTCNVAFVQRMVRDKLVSGGATGSRLPVRPPNWAKAEKTPAMKKISSKTTGRRKEHHPVLRLAHLISAAIIPS
jgi:hypothetical protein